MKENIVNQTDSSNPNPF